MSTAHHPPARPTLAVDIAGLLGFLLLSLAVATLGSMATTPAIPTWYAQLNKPTWTPPNIAFPIVWPILFGMMALSAWMVWRKGGQLALWIYALQLTLNAAWSWLFFYLQQPGLAFLEIIVLWLAIAATVVSFSRVSRTAALLLIPYLAWVSFAATLNFAIWRLNP
jgi:benzodiazapine receptor